MKTKKECISPTQLNIINISSMPYLATTHEQARSINILYLCHIKVLFPSQTQPTATKLTLFVKQAIRFLQIIKPLYH